MKVRFRKEINPYTVTDKAVFRNMDKTLTLYVRSDAPSLMANLRKAEGVLEKVSSDSTEEEKRNAARLFAWAVFGDESGRLVDFYDNPAAVISAVGMYFR